MTCGRVGVVRALQVPERLGDEEVQTTVLRVPPGLGSMPSASWMAFFAGSATVAVRRFRAAEALGRLGLQPLSRLHALRMVKRRAWSVGLSTDI